MQGLGGLDLVIHSAGIWPPEEVPVHEMTDERWHRTMRENVDAMFFVSRAAARVMGEGAEGGKARIEAGIPNGRVASAMDVAWAAVALCMPGARHVVGEILNVNGAVC